MQVRKRKTKCHASRYKDQVDGYTKEVRRKLANLSKEGASRKEIKEILGITERQYVYLLYQRDKSNPDVVELMKYLEHLEKREHEIWWLWVGFKIADFMGQGMQLSEIAGKFCLPYHTILSWAQNELVHDLYETGRARNEAFWLEKGREGVNQGKNFNNYAWVYNMKNRSYHFPSGQVWYDRVDIDAKISPDTNALLEQKATQERMLNIMMQEKLREMEQTGAITINRPEEVKQIEAGTTSRTGEEVD